jgi:hypothetical protein
MEFILSYTGSEQKMLKWKCKRDAKEPRALCVFLIRYYCDFTYKQICELIGRLTLTRISELNDIGLQLIDWDERYKNIMKDFEEYMAV